MLVSNRPKDHIGTHNANTHTIDRIIHIDRARLDLSRVANHSKRRPRFTISFSPRGCSRSGYALSGGLEERHAETRRRFRRTAPSALQSPDRALRSHAHAPGARTARAAEVSGRVRRPSTSGPCHGHGGCSHARRRGSSPCSYGGRARSDRVAAPPGEPAAASARARSGAASSGRSGGEARDR